MKQATFVLLIPLLLFALAPMGRAADLALGWDPSPSPDAIGYKLYYTTGTSNLFEGSGLRQGDSPIDVGNRLSIDLQGLADGTVYSFAVTSYDSRGEESSFSNTVTLTTAATGADPETPHIFIPALLSPAHQARNMPTSVLFDWSDPADERAVTYTLYLGTDPALEEGLLAATALPGQESGFPLPAHPVTALAALAGLTILPLRRVFSLPAAMLLLAGTLVLGACGGGGGSATVADNGEGLKYTNQIADIDSSSFEMHGFEPGTTYYWKVVADDGLNAAASEIHSFTTAAR